MSRKWLACVASTKPQSSSFVPFVLEPTHPRTSSTFHLPHQNPPNFLSLNRRSLNIATITSSPSTKSPVLTMSASGSPAAAANDAPREQSPPLEDIDESMGLQADGDAVPESTEPAGEPAGYGSDAESELSDLDDEAFEEYNFPKEDEDVIAVDADTVGALGKHKRAPGAASSATVAKKQVRRRQNKRPLDDDVAPGDSAPEPELSPEEQRRLAIEKQMDDAVKGPKKKRKKRNQDDLERMDDEKVENLRHKMLQAASQDRECVENNTPAVHKIAMLDEVSSALSQTSILNVALDGQILMPIRRWLEPLPNRSLPAYNVQKLMFEILAKLKPQVEHLRESGIGRIVMFYTKDSRPEISIKREAQRLVREWSRPILGKSDDYKMKEIRAAGSSQDAA